MERTQSGIPGPDDVGREVYYTGDMANPPAKGRIIAYHPPGRWSASLDLAMESEDEDGVTRIVRGITPASFSPGPGQRFWLMDDWRAERERKLRALQAAMQGEQGPAEKELP